MPFGVHLHAADIDRMAGRRHGRLEMGRRPRGYRKTGPCRHRHQRPCPGHELAGNRLPASLATRVMLCNRSLGMPCCASARRASDRQIFSSEPSALPLCQRVGGKQARARQTRKMAAKHEIGQETRMMCTADHARMAANSVLPPTSSRRSSIRSLCENCGTAADLKAVDVEVEGRDKYHDDQLLDT